MLVTLEHTHLCLMSALSVEKPLSIPEIVHVLTQRDETQYFGDVAVQVIARVTGALNKLEYWQMVRTTWVEEQSYEVLIKYKKYWLTTEGRARLVQLVESVATGH